ncbi:uncharacterized protein LOC124194312 isoform X1 [Daphnia pulex]|uniref:uncharacterized protein LOC124194312 isoform X1 n=1 Tax=Daphnia pulex TaxID=6669 RepID=UPI001EDFF9CE|nr:uncharacterized protein LOC124194312 isoform X1 [Daphnia pulex]XP_046444400.1 uncharacterized protein LOC124194312 isoform X1 [Daphnia pulex]XP_046444401.1 uncharacterized protein LOC124194312 isoform X1 [Daphnia pulex]
MSDEEESQELVMIAEKARSLLNRNERQVLSHCCHSYLSGRMGVHHFVDALLRLLPTPDKATFLVELRELVRDEDHDEYDYRVFTVPNRPFRSVQFQSGNSLDYEQSTECLLQVERGAVAPLLSGDGATGDHHYHHHPFYHNYQLLSQGNSPNCSPDIRESIRAAKSLQAMDFDSPCDVIGTTIQPVPLAASAQPFRGGLKETNIIPMMTIDLKTAFPTSSSSSAFKPLAAASNHVTKESFGGQKNVAAPTTTVPKQWPTNKTTTAEAPPAPAPAAGRRTGCRLPVSDDEPTEVVIRKSKKILGVAIEGGINTRHPLPRIITIDGKGTAFEAAGLRIGQTIISVDGRPMQVLHNSLSPAASSRDTETADSIFGYGCVLIDSRGSGPHHRQFLRRPECT